MWQHAYATLPHSSRKHKFAAPNRIIVTILPVAIKANFQEQDILNRIQP